MPPETPPENKPEIPPTTPNTPDVAAELAALKQEIKEAKEKTQAAQSYMEGIQKAAGGNKETPAPKTANDLFFEKILTDGPSAVTSVVDQKLREKAYFDTLQTNFTKENPHLQPMKEEIFGMTNAIVQQAQAAGQTMNWESALKSATEHYDGKHKQLLSIAGANASPGGHSFFPDSRYKGVDEDLFAMSDKEFFEKEMKPRDAARKKRNREGLAHYGFGR